jgi:PAS domain S-box-containing protein
MRDEEKSKEELISELRQLRERLTGGLSCPGNILFPEERLRGVLDEMPVVMAFVDSERRYVFCNRLYGAWSGLAPAEVIGRELEEVLGPERYSKVFPHVDKALSGESVSFETSGNSSGDGAIRINFVPHFGPGGCDGFFALGTDIGQLKKVEAALLESEALFTSLAEHIPGISIQGYRTSGELVYWNRESELLFGYTAKEAIGKSILDLIVPEGLYPLFEQCLDAGRNVKQSGEFMPRGELVLRGKDGQLVPVYTVHTAVYLDGREPLLFCIDIDMSDRKRIEEELLNAKKLEAIGMLAGGIAHDFNNLLFVILGNISMAQMRLEDQDPAMKHLGEAEKACLRAKDLTQKFITFSSGGGPVRSQVSIREMVSNVVSLILSGSNVTSVTEIPADLWDVDIDENQIRQTLGGIVANAREAMPRGGTIRVSAQNIEITGDDKNGVNLEEGLYVKILFADEGVGIPEENLARIFDPYFSTKYRGSQKGMGFGLAIAHSVIKRHKGTIKVDSRAGEGTTVSIFLPASAAKQKQLASKTVPGIIPRKRILLMDDEEMLNDLVKTMLEHLGYEVDIATDGETAIDLYSHALENGEDYDAVILDLTVKGGMGGRETVQKLLYLNPDVKAIVSSGYSSDPIMSDYASYGFREVLSKPYDLDKLRDILGRVMNG